VKTPKMINIKGQNFVIKENGDYSNSCFGCYFHKGTRWNKRGTGNCQGTTRILDICANNNFNHNIHNIIMVKDD